MIVVVADDQAGVRYLLEIVIREEGHEVYLAQNGLEAVELAKNVRPDLIFMDVRMPLMDGLEALEKIKSITPATKVVIMTAYGSEAMVAEALQKGAACCLAKPFDVGQIRTLVQDFNWKSFASEVRSTAS